MRRVYIAPQANLENTCGPLLPTIQNQVLVNIPSPDLGTDLTEDFDPNEYADNASFFLAPSDRGCVTLRVFCPEGETCSTSGLAAARVVSQAPNNCPPGETAAACTTSGYNPDDIYNPADAAAPTVTLLGGLLDHNRSGHGVHDPGATAFDTVDGNVPVTITGTVQTDTVGTYTLTYTATDAAGNTASATRTVIGRRYGRAVVTGSCSRRAGPRPVDQRALGHGDGERRRAGRR